ncbi:hypothetical protein A3K55_01835 [Candidatus Shapirobacteria bacterium RBG_13_44_7]|uniref:Uncharacterized protein n=1 Tax=Candidatus Shapirobacteria bacterium RBG_13_44_7 TaxID=1802149 RepID=A0A1F7SKV4_9BACT|nr:MAG: hypothetical protein A3K55_01835 [Candidatus Shapirobacteria bacterium RBG_13_44_7]
MDITQIVVILSLISITIVIIAVGIWLILVLREAKKILENTTSITSSIAKPVNSFSEFVMGFRNGLTIFNKFFPKDQKDVKE